MRELCAYGVAFFKTYSFKENGSRADHLKAAGIDPESELPEFPVLLGGLWQWFMVLNKTRPSGMGQGSITEAEIAALMSNRRIRFSSWECDALHMLDTKVREAISDMKKPPPPKKGKR